MQDIRSSEPFVALWSLPIFAEGCLSFECTVLFKFSGAGGAGSKLMSRGMTAGKRRKLWEVLDTAAGKQRDGGSSGRLLRHRGDHEKWDLPQKGWRRRHERHREQGASPPASGVQQATALKAALMTTTRRLWSRTCSRQPRLWRPSTMLRLRSSSSTWMQPYPMPKARMSRRLKCRPRLRSLQARFCRKSTGNDTAVMSERCRGWERLRPRALRREAQQVRSSLAPEVVIKRLARLHPDLKARSDEVIKIINFSSVILLQATARAAARGKAPGQRVTWKDLKSAIAGAKELQFLQPLTGTFDPSTFTRTTGQAQAATRSEGSALFAAEGPPAQGEGGPADREESESLQEKTPEVKGKAGDGDSKKRKMATSGEKTSKAVRRAADKKPVPAAQSGPGLKSFFRCVETAEAGA
ncbi:unnamed protein product [Symbiodinium microadriaticum]|nr:unnamed protein product [Symbiodinium microadriaticum]